MDVCPRCHAGTLRKRPVTYAAWHAPAGEGATQFVIAPLPAWLCDVCGISLFDEEALVWLTLLLGPAVEAESDQPVSPHGGKAPEMIGALDWGRTQ